MAPWPEVGERKAPDKEDKSNIGLIDVVTKDVLENTAESGLVEQSDQVSKTEDKEVLTLDEGQLKALLDEAMTYKNPKDREGKSELFNELLQEAEADESNSKGLLGKLPRNYYNLPTTRKRHNRNQGKECGAGVSRGGSLQNLYTLGMEGSRLVRSRRNGRSNETLVSARQREGGSLPSNVNVDDIDSIVYSSYTSRQVSEANTEESSTYVPEAAVPNGVEAVSNSISNPEFDDYPDDVNVPAASCCIGEAVLPQQQQQQHISLLSIPLPQLNASSELSSRCATLNKDPAEHKAKSLDENGNTLSVRSVDSNCHQDRKKPRRVKVKNYRNSRDFMSNDVEGFRGSGDIDALMEYIESSSNMFEESKSNKARSMVTRSNVKIRAKEYESRTMKRRKDKFQRCNSLEEISKTKLQDLTEEGSSERINGSTLSLTHDDAEVGKKSSWSDLSSPVKLNYINKTEKASQEGFQDSEFHIVTKKHRRKKRRSVVRTGSDRVGAKPVFIAHDRNLQYRHVPSITPQTRRKSTSSVPPSDKSDSSDLDSVHSLPVSSTTTRMRLGKSSVSGGSTPQASYADIARSVGKCLPDYYCADSKASSSCLLKRDAVTDTTCDNHALFNEEYPPLDIKSVDLLLDSFVRSDCVTYKDNKISEKKVNLYNVPIKTVIAIPTTVNESVTDSCDVPSSCVKNLAGNSNFKRPPVILVDEPTTSPQILTELVFGFEVNQQLLETDFAVSNLNNLGSSKPMNLPRPSRLTVPRDSTLDRIIYYINSGWEGTMRDVEANRARYYDGQ